MIHFSLLAILGYALALSRSARWSAEAALFFVVCLLMVALFWAGYFEVLHVAAWIILAGGLVALLAALIPRSFEQPLRASLTPGLALVVVIAVVHWLSVGGMYVSSWDEFSHWALQGKVIALTHALPAKDSAVVFKDYPPAAALFQYFATLRSQFAESDAIAAQGFITLSAVATTLQRFSWRQLPAASIVLAIGYGLVYLLGQGFNSLLIDQPLGAVFGATLIVFFTAPRGTRWTIALIIPGLLVLPLMKAIGLHLSLLAAGIVALGTFVNRAATSRTANAETRSSWWSLLVAAGLSALLLLPLASKVGWDQYKRRIEAAESFNARPSFGQFLDSFSASRATERDRATIGAFKRALVSESATIVDELPLIQRLLDEFPSLQRLELARTNPPQLLPITTMQWFLLFTLLAIPLTVVQSDRGGRRLAFVLQVGLALGFVVYAFGHLVGYLYSFSEYEGTRVASFSRYMRTYLLGWSLGLLSLLAVAMIEGRFRWAAIAIGCVLAVLSIAFMPARGVQFFERPAGMIPQRASLLPQLDAIGAHPARKSGVYIVFQNTNGFEHWIAKYELAPIRTNLDCWSVGSSYGRDDAWTCDISAEQLSSRLREYGLLYLGKVDDEFRGRFGSLFRGGPARDSFLFEIHKLENGSIELSPVAP